MSEKLRRQEPNEFRESELSTLVSNLEALQNSPEFEDLIEKNLDARHHFAKVSNVSIGMGHQSEKLRNSGLFPPIFYIKNAEIFYSNAKASQNTLYDVTFTIGSSTYQLSTIIDGQSDNRKLKVAKSDIDKPTETTICDAGIADDLVKAVYMAETGELEESSISQIMEDLSTFNLGESILSTRVIDCPNGWSVIATLSSKSMKNALVNEVHLDVGQQQPAGKILIYQLDSSLIQADELKTLSSQRRFIDGSTATMERDLALQTDDVPYELNPKNDFDSWLEAMRIVDETTKLAMEA